MKYERGIDVKIYRLPLVSSLIIANQSEQVNTGQEKLLLVIVFNTRIPARYKSCTSHDSGSIYSVYSLV